MIQNGCQMDYILCFSVCLWFIDSETAGPIGLELGWMIEGICRNILAGDFVGFLESKMAAKWIIFCIFFRLYVINRLRDGLTYRAETWLNGRGYMRNHPREGIFLCFFF